MTGPTNLEGQVQKETRRRPGLRNAVIIAAIGAASYGIGRYQEANTHGLEYRQARKEIVESALEGYSWKSGSDPTFFEYRGVLEKDTTDWTMIGKMMKPDGTDAGPVRREGHIGYTLPERAKNGWEGFKDKVHGLYDRIFNKDEKKQEK
jgi:hypothetical protein